MSRSVCLCAFVSLTFPLVKTLDVIQCTENVLGKLQKHFDATLAFNGTKDTAMSLISVKLVHT